MCSRHEEANQLFPVWGIFLLRSFFFRKRYACLLRALIASRCFKRDFAFIKRSFILCFRRYSAAYSLVLSRLRDLQAAFVSRFLSWR